MAERSDNAKYTPEKAAQREAERQFKKYQESQDKRSALDRLKDMQRNPDAGNAAANAAAAFNNAAGTPLQMQAASVAAMMAKIQPAWKDQPVAPAPADVDIPDRPRGFRQMELEPHQRAMVSDLSTHQLQLVNASTGGVAKIKVLAGDVSGGTVAETTVNVANNDKIWIEFAVTYQTGTGSWKADNTTRTVGTPAGTPTAESGSKAVVVLGSVTVSGGTVTAILDANGSGSNQSRYGPIFWSRPAGSADYESDWISPGP